jgi:hypothetical protein
VRQIVIGKAIGLTSNFRRICPEKASKPLFAVSADKPVVRNGARR